MRLLTHNMLMCNKNNCTQGYPLKIEINQEPDSYKVEPQPVNPEFVKKMLSRMDYKALYETAKSLGIDLPVNFVNEDLENENFINAVHHAIFDFHVLEGRLVCPSCSHNYKISKGDFY
ncbi:uncharacterized protein TA09955 [Theileria annulata]|uniref:Trm112p-like protein n=1 Tax=Theileria annulata TaxID=5874 RepID=Q4U8Q3_THEAN|nr:uncharacterized protein TA09955 [Theileria annulata]CAI76800.1 hypothetical protein, conserved [Theileria annulata]|eukprot:XP_953425.1 hypothetical protein, conserved [Theileria annulata]